MTVVAALLDDLSSSPCTYMVTPVPEDTTLRLSSGIRHTCFQKTHKMLGKNCKRKKRCGSAVQNSLALCHLPQLPECWGDVWRPSCLAILQVCLFVCLFLLLVVRFQPWEKNHFFFPEFVGRCALGILK